MCGFFYKNNLYEMCDNFTIKIVFRDFSSFIIGSYKFSEDAIIIKLEDNEFNREYFSNTEITNIIKTKAEAEHYLHHASVTRTETLPFLTWEEFDKGDRLIRFTGKNGEKCKLEGYQKDDKQSGFIDVVVNGTGSNIDFDYTEANFYKAYDECVRLFREEE